MTLKRLFRRKKSRQSSKTSVDTPREESTLFLGFPVKEVIGHVDFRAMTELGSLEESTTEHEGWNYSFYSDENGTVYLHYGWTSADSSYGALSRMGSSSHTCKIPLELLKDILEKLASQPNTIDHIEKERIEEIIKEQLPGKQEAEPSNIDY